MSYINKIAYYRNIRNEEPNKELAEELASSSDTIGIDEIASFLNDKNSSVASDCLAVLYHVGYVRPDLIEKFTETFLNMLDSKKNRMVWGSMIALSTIAPLKKDFLFGFYDKILKVTKEGSLITEVWGIKTIVKIISGNDEYKKVGMADIFRFVEDCRPIDFCKRVETVLEVVNTPKELEDFKTLIEEKKQELSESQLKKLNTILKKVF